MMRQVENDYVNDVMKSKNYLVKLFKYVHTELFVAFRLAENFFVNQSALPVLPVLSSF